MGTFEAAERRSATYQNVDARRATEFVDHVTELAEKHRSSRVVPTVRTVEGTKPLTKEGLLPDGVVRALCAFEEGAREHIYLFAVTASYDGSLLTVTLITEGRERASTMAWTIILLGVFPIVVMFGGVAVLVYRSLAGFMGLSVSLVTIGLSRLALNARLSDHAQDDDVAPRIQDLGLNFFSSATSFMERVQQKNAVTSSEPKRRRENGASPPMSKRQRAREE